MVRLCEVPRKIDIGSRIEGIREYLASHPSVAAAFLFGSYGTEYQKRCIHVVSNDRIRDKLQSRQGFATGWCIFMMKYHARKYIR